MWRRAAYVSGWSRFTPSVTALRQMMADVGFREIQVRKSAQVLASVRLPWQNLDMTRNRTFD
jgi:hypothetical protein